MERRAQPWSFHELAQQLTSPGESRDAERKLTESEQFCKAHGDRVFEMAREIDERRNPQSFFSYEYDALPLTVR